jgi:hypothetical protein
VVPNTWRLTLRNPSISVGGFVRLERPSRGLRLSEKHGFHAWSFPMIITRASSAFATAPLRRWMVDGNGSPERRTPYLGRAVSTRCWSPSSWKLKPCEATHR